MSEPVDLSGFPVIRIDQIPLLDSTILHNAQTEVIILIQELVDPNGTKPPLVFYLQRQLEAMKHELAKRLASDRISSMLQNANEIFDHYESTRPLKPDHEDMSVKTSRSESDKLRPTPAVSFVPVPLPSQVHTTPARNANSKTTTPEKSDTTVISKELQNQVPSSLPPRQRPLSGSDKPSKKSVAAVYQNFGSMFVVAATERRKRYFPQKKEPDLSVEESKEKDRAERRKVAMKRLVERREQRQAEVAERKLKMKREKMKVASSENSSGSESISGGDDDMEVNMDAQELKLVQQAIMASLPCTDKEVLRQTIENNKSKQKIQANLNRQQQHLPRKQFDSESSSSVNSIQSQQHTTEVRPSRAGVQHTRKSVTQATTTTGAATRPAALVRERKAQTFTRHISSHSAGSTGQRSSVGERLCEDNSEAHPEDEDVNKPNILAVTPVPRAQSAAGVMGSNPSASVCENSDAEVKAGYGESLLAPEHGYEFSQDLSLKNMSALEMIRKMKSEKLSQSPQVDGNQQPLISSSQALEAPIAPLKPMTDVKENFISNNNESDDVAPITNQTDEGVMLAANMLPVLTTPVKADNSSHPIMATTAKLISFEDNCYHCGLGPDELPGLRAWSLLATDQTSSPNDDVQWNVDFEKYKNIIPASPKILNLREKRSQNRRHLSYGSVVLAEESTQLLLGHVRLEDGKALQESWMAALQRFDNYAESLSTAESEMLFEKVEVCGNCYAVCRKLENLLTTYFTRLNAVPKAEPCDSYEMASCDPHIQDLISAQECVVEENSEFQAADATISLISEDQEVNTACIDDSNTGCDVVESDVGDDEFDVDDDESILPCYAEIVEAIGVEQESVASKSPDSTTTADSAQITDMPLISSSGKGIMINLTDYYPSIGMIFPAAYSMIGPKPVDAVSAKLLVESMVMQSRMYEDWLEVMSDYATVFSEGRGCPRDVKTDSDNATGNLAVYKGGTRALHYRIKSSRPEVTSIVNDVFNNSFPDWEELPAGLGLGVSWNFLWSWSKPRVNMAHLLVWQRVNHFQDSKQLTRKDLLKKNLARFTDMTGKSAEAFEIMPQTFLLPHEYTQFVKAFTELEATRVETQIQNYWIMKPVGLSRGRGISLVRDVSALTYSQASVVQRYMERPLCLDGYKFDLRIYVLVTSFKPLEAFIYREGFARVSTETYSTDPESMSNKFIHLTNSSIQKYNTNPLAKDNPLAGNSIDVGGSKISFLGEDGLWRRLSRGGLNTEVIWRDICLLVIKSLVVIDEKMANQPCCFEVFGYDVLIDSSLKPWLLEVNASPSLARENSLDNRVKDAMVRDTILLLDLAPYDRAAVARVMKRRLTDMAKNKQNSIGKKDIDLETDLKSILGSYRPRRVGEEPKNMGQFQKLCPDTKLHAHVVKLKNKLIKS